MASIMAKAAAKIMAYQLMAWRNNGEIMKMA
jgi:hypothetical protein